MIKPGEIHSISGKQGVRDTQIEKDYVISWIISGIANNKYLKKHLIFKGGTVLKKMYFPEYRFSEDLDFTFTGKDFNIEAIRLAFNELFGWVYKESRIKLSLKDEKQYETGNFNFYISYIGPLGGAGANKDIKVDISPDELIYNKPEEMVMISQYSDLTEDYSIFCYSLGELIAEKMRSLIQRTAPRDIYDLWYLFEYEGQDIKDHIYAFCEKAKYKGYNPNDLIRVLQEKEKTFALRWRDHLSDQIKKMPDFNDVWRELGKHWRVFQKFIE